MQQCTSESHVDCEWNCLLCILHFHKLLVQFILHHLGLLCFLYVCVQCWCTLVGEKQGKVGVGPLSSAPDWPATSATWSCFSNSCSSIPPSFRNRPPKPCLSGSAAMTKHIHPLQQHYYLKGVFFLFFFSQS